MDGTESSRHPLKGRIQKLMMVEAACAGVALIVAGLMLRGVLPDIAGSLMDDMPFRPGLRPLIELSFAAPWLMAGYLVRQRRLILSAELKAWQPMAFDEPIRTEVVIRDFSGRKVHCSFEAMVVLWFADSSAHADAEAVKERLATMIADLLAKAAHDPSLRQSTGYLSDWVNDNLMIGGLARTELSSSRFRVLPDGPPAVPAKAANSDRPAVAAV